ncbi:hypothetical protein K2173_001783 [Erythroxylum novogranatense]|uniref:Glucosidase II beta subunit N-terminal domain-containing protein n=1 Tax=Erythroxylum novogranatense TaxID=1862640 RepID=A0AAV8SJ77_9ROSI|nr:hypothetical protein K2173_001783 [Erythroxylum novogranatense]
MRHYNTNSYSYFFLSFIPTFYFLSIPSSSHPVSPLLGVHPLDENYFASQLIKCKDGSKSFTRDRLNDNFCDCVDGTDEPGTPACPRGKFYCRNLGSAPQFIFSSRINDRICDCCDGSDEYDKGVNCPNTCVMGGNVAYESGSYISSIDIKESRAGILSDDLLQKVEGLKVVLLLQIVVFIICVVIFCMLHRRVRSKRRRNRENA